MTNQSTEQSMAKFTRVTRPTDPEGVLLHNDAPVWIVRYPATAERAQFFQAYRAADHVAASRKPWTHDNKRIGTDRGFPTIFAAINACEAFISDRAALAKAQS